MVIAPTSNAFGLPGKKSPTLMFVIFPIVSAMSLSAERHERNRRVAQMFGDALGQLQISAHAHLAGQESIEGSQVTAGDLLPRLVPKYEMHIGVFGGMAPSLRRSL